MLTAVKGEMAAEPCFFKGMTSTLGGATSPGLGNNPPRALPRGSHVHRPLVLAGVVLQACVPT
jgi:hypothetical protein